jgi:hypothetical protein
VGTHSRLGFSTAAVVALAMLLPASTLAASPFTYRLLYGDCGSSNDPSAPYNIFMGVKVKEFAKSGANYFRVRTKLHQRDTREAPWSLVRDWGWQYSNTFPNDATNYYHVREQISYHHSPIGRMTMRIQVWSSTPAVLSEKTLRVTCDWTTSPVS